MKRMWLWSFIAVVGVGLLVAGCRATRAGYESAPYKVVRSEGKFELRDYPAFTVVETPMANASGSDGSFGRLFRFITGANEGQQKIAMTTPVFMSGSATNLTPDARPAAAASAVGAGGTCDREIDFMKTPVSAIVENYLNNETAACQFHGIG